MFVKTGSIRKIETVIFIGFSVWCVAIIEAHYKPLSLKDLAALHVIETPSLLDSARDVNDDLQELLNEKLITIKIKNVLFPVKIRTPENPNSVQHQGVCGLETLSKTRQIISIGCDGKIAVCDEDRMDNCDVVNTKTSWYCATMQCEPPTICLGDLSGDIGFMRIKDQKPQKIFKAHRQAVNALSLSGNQKQLISCSNDYSVKLWNIADNKKIAEFHGHTKSVKNAFSLKDHQKIVSAGTDHTIRIFDIGTAQEEQCYCVFNGVNFFRLARHPHEQLAVAGLNNGTVALWDIRKNAITECLKGHKTVVSALICSDCGNYIASASWDGSVRLWDIRMLGCSLLASHKDWVQSVASLHNFQKIVSGSRDGSVRLWDVSSVLAVDQMNNLKETAAKAALIAAEKPISNDERLAMLKRITTTHPE